MFGTSPQFSPYLGGQIPQIPQQQGPALGQQMSPLLLQLMQNPAFLARLQQIQGTGFGGIPAQQAQYGLGRSTQPIPTGAYSLG